MLLVRRPKTPDGFNLAARSARKAIRDKIQAGARPLSPEFEDAWSDFKHVLAKAQGDRCGYCDRKVLGGDDGTVDHFRPKGMVEALHDDRSTWGAQKEHSASVTGRLLQDVSEFGYHWLAYAWNNYVFACICCNVKWKRTLFPVAAHPRCCPPRPKGREEPLLMSCYGALRPSDHIQFNPDGTVEPLDESRHGYETIRTVGLYRDPLCNERKAVAEDVHALIQEYADGDELQQETALRGLCRIGHEDRAFAGVARAIVERSFGMTWETFRAEIARV